MTILVNGYIGKKVTGIGRTLIELLRRMADEEFKIVIYTNFDNPELIALESKNISVKKIRISRESVLLNLIFNAFLFPFIAIGKKYTAVYISNFMPVIFKFKPTVVVIHDLIEFNVADKFSKARMLYRKMILPTMARYSNKIITVSNSSKNDLIKFFKVKEEKIKVIYNSYFEEVDVSQVDVDPSEFSKKFGFEAKNYLLYVGTVDYPGKNIHNAIKGFEHFKSNYDTRDLKFVLCGMPGKDSKVIIDLIENSPYKEDIHYLGFVNDEDLNILYKNANLTIFLSYYEGFGLPVIESMQYGVPVIVSDRSCLPEVAGDAGFIVPAEGFEVIGKTIDQILNEVDSRLIKEKMSNNLKRFSWDRSARQTLDVLRSVGN